MEQLEVLENDTFDGMAMRMKSDDEWKWGKWLLNEVAKDLPQTSVTRGSNEP